jgi:tetratricopeptide (TPR) repeat protein
VRVATLVVLCLWAALDQTRFVLGTSADSLPALRLASALNPHDTAVQQRKARLLISQRRFHEAYDDYLAYLVRQPRDVTALVNAGVLAMQLGRESDAVRKWETALDIDPALDRVPRYLAQFWAVRADTLERSGKTHDAGRAYRNALTLDQRAGDDAASGVDWFNYGQFLQRQNADPRIVLACFLHAETLLAGSGDGQLETVRTARAEVERTHPGATGEARASHTPLVGDALSLYPAGLAP